MAPEPGQNEKKKKTIMQQRVEQNLELLHAKVDEMDHIQGIVNINPLQRTFMPQMENKKRYQEV